METIFPFVIAALYFAFQIYSNFKKEQEKAKKRDPSQRSVGEQSPTYKEKRDWDKALQQKEVVLSETPKISKYEDFTGLVEEVRRSKEVHRSLKHNNRSFEPSLQPMEENPYSDFDLRDAVIKAAILERPYK